MRHWMILGFACALATGCSTQDAKSASAGIGKAVALTAVYHLSGLADSDQDGCRDYGGDRNAACEDRQQQAFTNGGTPEQKREQAKAQRAATREQAQRFAERWAARNTPNCLDHGVGCNADKLASLEERPVVRQRERVGSRSDADFSLQPSGLLAP